MTAIVIYKEANTMAIISIFISLLSVASKSLVFAMGISNSFKQLFFNWLCAVTDFFGIFFVVCWVFYEPHDESLQEAFSTIQSVWLWKLYIFELPLVLIPAFLLYFSYCWAAVTEIDDVMSICARIALVFFAFFSFSFMFVGGCIAGLLIAEITCWTWFAALLLILSSSRLPGYSKQSLQFYFTLLKWINSAEKHQIGSRYKGCTSYTKQQDKMMRLASANFELYGGASNYQVDSRFHSYLDAHRTADQYMGVTYSGLRANVIDGNRKNAQYLPKFWDHYGDMLRSVWQERSREYDKWKRERDLKSFNSCALMTTLSSSFASLTLIFGPIYPISRMVHLVFPWFIVLYLYFEYDLLIWTSPHIDTFQLVMITVYFGLSIFLAILLYLNVKEQYLLWHILPFSSQLNQVTGLDGDRYLKKIANHYFGMTVIPIRRAIVIDHFGPDLGEIIVSYLPNDDEFESAGKLQAVTLVV